MWYHNWEYLILGGVGDLILGGGDFLVGIRVRGLWGDYSIILGTVFGIIQSEFREAIGYGHFSKLSLHGLQEGIS